MEVDHIGTSERGKMRFGSSDLNHKQTIVAKEEGVKIWFPPAATSDNEFFSPANICYHPRLTTEKEMLEVLRSRQP